MMYLLHQCIPETSLDPVSEGCSPNLFSGEAEITDCVHWIPGWFRTAGDPADLFDQLCAHSQEEMQKRLELLGSPQQLEGEDATDSKVLQESHAEEVFAITQAHDNLVNMQLELWRDHGIAAKGTRGDGNCGIEMLLSFAENMPVIQGQAADRGDLLEIKTAYRKELKRLWESVCGDSFWQDLWRRLVGSRVNMDQWKALLEPEPAPAPGTPTRAQNKRSKEAAETPEKTFAPGKLLAIGEGEPSLEEVVVAAGEPASKRPKPSGKPKALSEVITFGNYFPKFLAEKGITHREWLREHKKSGLHLSFLGSFRLGRDMLLHLPRVLLGTPSL